MSKTLKGIKVKLIPNNKQKALFIQAVGTRRFAYNWVLDKQMKAFINKEKFKSANELCRELVQLKNTDEYIKPLCGGNVAGIGASGSSSSVETQNTGYIEQN